MKKKKGGGSKKNLLDKKGEKQSRGKINNNISNPDENKNEKDPFLDTIAKCKKIDLEKVTRFWQNNSSKEVCAMLAAISEVIQEKNSTEIEIAAAYFSALLMALDTCKLESKPAIIFLLSMFVPQLSPGMVEEKFNLVATLLRDILQNSLEDSNLPTALVRSTIVTFSVLLQHVKRSEWSQSLYQEHFKALLGFTCHTRPKVRKAAQEGVATVLADDHEHPAASICSKFCCDKLENIESSSLCHLLLLVGLTAHTFSSKDLEKLCEAILTHVSTAAPEDNITRSVGFQTIGKVFSNSPSIYSLPPTLNHQILNQVRACWQQNDSDSEKFPHDWFNVMQQGVACLSSRCGKVSEKDLVIYITQVYKLCEDAFKWMSNHKETACKIVTTCLNHLSKLVEGSEKFSDEVSNSLTKISNLLVEGLSERHMDVWDQMLAFVQTGFSNFLTAAVANKAIARMAEMLNIPQFKHGAELDSALGVAIKTYGPGCFIRAIPLKVGGGDLKELTKMVELLEKYISHTELTHFFTHIKPLAEKCGKANRRLLWRLLPSYCRYPTDITFALNGERAKMLGDMLLLRGAEHSDVRISVIRAIGNLVETSQDTNRLKKLGQNFLSLLSNVYLECGDKLKEGASKQQQVVKNKEQQLAIEVMSSYLKLLPADVCAHHYRNAYQSYLELTTAKPDDQTDKTRDVRALALFDLMIACVAHVTGDDVDGACDVMLTMIGDAELEHSRQKKAYRLLEQICAANSENYVVSNIEKLRVGFAKAVCVDSSKASRLRALGHVVAVLDDAERRREFIGEVVIAECVSSLRANFNEKCKTLAFDMLVQMARAYGDLDRFVDRILEGLQVESAVLNSCTIMALSRLAFELKDEVSGEALDRCTEMVVHFLTTNTREISKAALGYVSVVMSLGEAHQALLARHAESVVKAIAGWKGDTMRHFRARLSTLLQRLARKLGREAVESWCSDELKKHFKHDDDVASKRKADDVGGEAAPQKRQKTIPPPRPKTSNGGKKKRNKKGGGSKQHHGKRRN